MSSEDLHPLDTAAAFAGLPPAAREAFLGEVFGDDQVARAGFLANVAHQARVAVARDDVLAYAQHVDPHFDLAPHLLQIANGLPTGPGQGKRIVITLPPRHGKSQLISRIAPAWWLGRHPTMKIIISSYGADLVAGFGRYARNVLASPAHQEVFPACSLAPDSTAADTWRTSAGGEFFARGAGAALTGEGGDVLVVDDPIKNAEEADSQLMRDNLWSWFNSTLRTRMQPGASLIVVATRWHHDDIIGRILRGDTGEGWDVLHMPAIDTEGRALWPERYPVEWLATQRAAVGARVWSALYQGQPTPDTGDFFRSEWFQFYGTVPDGLSVYGCFDLAYTKGNDSDYTVLCIFGLDADLNVYILDWYRARVSTEEFAARLATMINRWQPQQLIYERDPGTSASIPRIKRILEEHRVYRSFIDLSAAGDKAAKCRATQGMCEAGKILLPAHAKPTWWPDLEAELLCFPAGLHDDQADTLGLIGRAMQRLRRGRAQVEPELREYRLPDGRTVMLPQMESSLRLSHGY